MYEICSHGDCSAYPIAAAAHASVFEANTYTIALMNRFCRTASIVPVANVLKVVKPPQKPVPSASVKRVEEGRRADNAPSRNDPLVFTASTRASELRVLCMVRP